MANIPSVASRQLYPGESLLCNDSDLVLVAGSFEVADDADVTNVRGSGFQVDQGDAEGQWVITFANPYPMLVAAVPGFIDTNAANDDVVVTFETYNATAGTMVIKASKESAGTLAPDDTNIAGERISFVCIFHRKNSLSVTRTS